MKTKVYRKIIGGRTFNVIEEPNSDYFEFEILFKTGSYLEDVIAKKHGINVYGGLHLLEHMSFKSPRDWGTEEFIKELKSKGNRNATTGFNSINFFYKTITKHKDFAVKAVLNIAYNNLAAVTDNEFKSERDVVINEVNRYTEDKHMLFRQTVEPTYIGLPKECNVLGTKETVGQISLDGLRVLKEELFRSRAEFFLVLDPVKIGNVSEYIIQEILPVIEDYEVRNDADAVAVNNTYEYKVDHCKKYIDIKADQSLFNIMFDLKAPALVSRFALDYIRELSGEHSMFNVFREKYGITYGAFLYSEPYIDENRLIFTIDTKPEDIKLAKRLLGEILVNVAKAYDQKAHESVKETLYLKEKMGHTNRLAIGKYTYNILWNKCAYSKEDKLLLARDAYAFVEKIYKDIKSDDVLQYLNKIRDTYNANDYVLVTNDQQLLED